MTRLIRRVTVALLLAVLAALALAGAATAQTPAAVAGRPVPTATCPVSVCDLPPPTSVTDASVVRPAPGRTAIVKFTLKLDQPYDQPDVFTYHTVDGTAVAGRDYVAVSGGFTLQPGQTSKTVTVTILGGPPTTPTRTFHLQFMLVESGGTVGAGESTGTITSPLAGPIDTGVTRLKAAVTRLQTLPASPARSAAIQATLAAATALCRLAGRMC